MGLLNLFDREPRTTGSAQPGNPPEPPTTTPALPDIPVTMVREDREGMHIIQVDLGTGEQTIVHTEPKPDRCEDGPCNRACKPAPPPNPIADLLTQPIKPK